MSSFKNNITPINTHITASELMLINHEGAKIGLVSIDDALQKASEESLDLVQVSPSDSKPSVCKLLD